MKRLEGKTAIITGGAGGIGAAAVRLFVREGAFAVIADIDREKGAAMERECNQEECTECCRFLPCDVSSSADVRHVVEETERMRGGIDILYNNASVYLAGADGPLTEIDESVWEKVIPINLRSVFLFSKYTLPVMIRRGSGAIINTASSAGVIGIPNCDAYTASKGATVQLTKSMAVEYGRFGIRVNCIAPAAIMTPMVRASNPADGSDDFDEFSFLHLRTPIRRYGTAEEIASVALFLASGESSYLNGAIIRADGGITICGDLSKAR